MSEIETALKAIESKKRMLVSVADPVEILKGSVEIDAELHKLAKNLKILTELEYIAGSEKVRLEEIYNRRTMEMAKELNVDRLEEIGVVKSNKFKYIKSALFHEQKEVDEMNLKYKYFKDIRETYTEWINVFKKTRMIE